MKQLYMWFAILLFLMVFAGSCEEKQTTEGDKMPPAAPFLFAATDVVTNMGVLDTERDSGIDGVPGGNWIQLQWQSPTENEDGSDLIDLSGYMIYRGVFVDTLQQVVLNEDPIAIIEEPLRTNFVDVSSLTLGRTYYYAMTAYDEVNNNSAFSDTVGYRLVTKAVPFSPEDNSIFPTSEPLLFSWQAGDSGIEDFFTYYVKVFRIYAERDSLIWKSKHFSPFEQPFQAEYGATGIVRNGFETLMPGEYKWRVDIYGYTPEWGYWGSESREIRFYLQ